MDYQRRPLLPTALSVANQNKSAMMARARDGPFTGPLIRFAISAEIQSGTRTPARVP